MQKWRENATKKSLHVWHCIGTRPSSYTVITTAASRSIDSIGIFCGIIATVHADERSRIGIRGVGAVLIALMLESAVYFEDEGGLDCLMFYLRFPLLSTALNDESDSFSSSETKGSSESVIYASLVDPSPFNNGFSQ